MLVSTPGPYQRGSSSGSVQPFHTSSRGASNVRSSTYVGRSPTFGPPQSTCCNSPGKPFRCRRHQDSPTPCAGKQAPRPNGRRRPRVLSHGGYDAHHAECRTQRPPDHLRPAALEHPGLPQPGAPHPQPRPAGGAGHPVHPSLLSQPHLHADARLDHHRQVPEPARRLVAGHQAAGVGAHCRRGPAGGRRAHGSGGQGRTSSRWPATRSTPRWRRIRRCRTWRSGAASTARSTASSTSSWRATIPTKPTSASTTRCGWSSGDWTTGATTSARPPAPTTASGAPGRSRRRSTTAPGSPSAAASCWMAMPGAKSGSCSGRASSIRTPSTWFRSRGTGCTIRPP